MDGGAWKAAVHGVAGLLNTQVQVGVVVTSFLLQF